MRVQRQLPRGIGNYLGGAAVRAIVLLIVLLLLAAEDRGGVAGPARRLSIATGASGSVYFVLGAGLARLLSHSLPGVHATAEVTPGGVANMHLLADGRADLAFAPYDTAYEAWRGVGEFTGKAVPLRILAPLYDNYHQLVTLEETGIRRLQDLRGRRVSVGGPASATEFTTLRILQAAGLHPDRDIHKERLTVVPASDALRDRKIDAFFFQSGVPTPAILELASLARIRLVPLEDVLSPLRARYGELYFRIVISKVVYPGMTEDVPVVGVRNLLVVHRTFLEDLAYAIVRLIFERRSELEAVHREARGISLLRVRAGEAIPFHPGAVRYFRERGVPGF
ncbi:MAG: TAXI family TRAP transporter solute-binding subunit [Armatimonadota bacterium]|nr:TAXI family TRAP transporter solute-binding subunit [Armatimonadota bacterium]